MVDVDSFVHPRMKPQSHASIPSRQKPTRLFLLWRAAVIAFSLVLAGSVVGETRPSNEDYLIDAWLTDNGLPENIVNAITQTPDGYLWCGTTHGLARFDGVRFKVFSAQNTPELGSARIR